MASVPSPKSLGCRTNCTPDRPRPSWPYFQAGGLRQIDLILVEGQQLSRFEMDCRGHMKNVQQSVASGHCETWTQLFGHAMNFLPVYRNDHDRTAGNVFLQGR